MSIYQKYCYEKVDENGRLTEFKLNLPDNFNFGYDIVDAIAAEEPDKRALVWCNTENEERVFTFGEIKKLSDKAANVFKDAGLKKGDRMLLVLKRHYEYWIAVVALLKLGVVAIPATNQLTVDDLVYRLNCSKARGVLCTAQNEFPQKVIAALERSQLESCKLWCAQGNADGFENFDDAIEKADDHWERIPTQLYEPMLMYFTSGTTGYPKGVMHDHSYPLAHVPTAKYWQQAEDNGLHFTVAETGWAKASWGKIYGQWAVGSAIMVYDFDNFEPKNLITIINRYGVTSFCAPPTVYRYLVRKEIPPMPNLKHCSTAGEMLAAEVFRLFEEKTGMPIYEGFGQTESTLLLGNMTGYVPTHGSMGRVNPLYNIELWDSDCKKVKDGEIGEIVVIPPEGGKQPGIFCQYLDNEEQQAYAWRGGAYHTGDSAWRDENGLYWFNGRFDDIIKTGGYRVGPSEIENVLMEHPAVMECGVIGIPDKLRGQAIKAVVVLSSGYEPSKQLENDIKNFCNAKLAEYKWIRVLQIVDEMPKTISGKIIKTELRKQSEE